MAARRHAGLETYGVSRKLVRERALPPRDGRVFRDEEELPVSSDLLEGQQAGEVEG